MPLGLAVKLVVVIGTRTCPAAGGTGKNKSGILALDAEHVSFFPVTSQCLDELVGRAVDRAVAGLGAIRDLGQANLRGPERSIFRLQQPSWGARVDAHARLPKGRARVAAAAHQYSISERATSVPAASKLLSVLGWGMEKEEIIVMCVSMSA
eukprot:scaffold21249_cov32-Tisochrysis_lutea.AAC.3